MARNRTISPDLWGSEQFQELSWPAASIYIGMISMADDFGRFRWSVKALANYIVGRRSDVTDADVERWMAEIRAVGLVEVYEIEGRTIAQHPNWDRYQYVNRKMDSKLPRADGTYEKAKDRPSKEKQQPSPVESHAQNDNQEPEIREDDGPVHGAFTERSRSIHGAVRERNAPSVSVSVSDSVSNKLLRSSGSGDPDPKNDPVLEPTPSVRPDRRTAHEQTADAALTLIRPAIEPNLVGMTWSDWRIRNRRHAVVMARSGMSADAISAAHASESARYGQTIMQIYVLQDRMNRPERGQAGYSNCEHDPETMQPHKYHGIGCPWPNPAENPRVRLLA